MAVKYLAGNRIYGTDAERAALSGTTPDTMEQTSWKELGKTTLGSGTFTPSSSFNVEYLVVGGGGGAGTNNGGGGGAGAFRTATGHGVTAQAYTITVGAGSTGTSGNDDPANGGDSSFGSITANGGNAGARGGQQPPAYSGNGSGGGGGNGASGRSGGTYGNDGANGDNAPDHEGGGGGGSSANASGRNGGNGTASSITGSSVTYAGGGGAGAQGGSTSTGGSGGGGNGSNSGVGSNATGYGSGGGGGAGGSNKGGDGSGGIVVIKFATSGNSFSQTGGTVDTTTVSGQTIITWVSSASTITVSDFADKDNLMIMWNGVSQTADSDIKLQVGSNSYGNGTGNDRAPIESSSSLNYIIGEKILANNPLIGKTVDKLGFRLYRMATGTVDETLTFGVWDFATGDLKSGGSFGTVRVDTLPVGSGFPDGKQVDITHGSGGVVIAANDIIGVRCDYNGANSTDRQVGVWQEDATSTYDYGERCNFTQGSDEPSSDSNKDIYFYAHTTSSVGIDTGSNYSWKQSRNGAANTNDDDTTDIPVMGTQDNSSTFNSFGVMNVRNGFGEEKRFNINAMSGEDGAGNGSNSLQAFGKWDNKDGRISSVKISLPSNSAQFSSGSELIVLGCDDEEANSGTNFWNEIDSVVGAGSSSTLTTDTFSAKRYLEFSIYTTAYVDGKILFNSTASETDSNRRFAANGGTAESPNVNQNGIQVLYDLAPAWIHGWICNVSANEKLLLINTVETNNTTGSSAIYRMEVVAKWTKKGEDITKMFLTKTGTNFTTDERLRLWGGGT